MKNLYSSVSLFRCVNHLKVIGLMCFLSLSLTDTFLGQSKKEQILILIQKCDSLNLVCTHNCMRRDSLQSELDQCRSKSREAVMKSTAEFNQLLNQIDELQNLADEDNAERIQIKERIENISIEIYNLLNNIPTVSIGNQVWMSKNLDVITFRNGDTIPEAKTKEEWVLAGENKKPAWCYNDNNPSHGHKYGKLYNFYALSDVRILAPLGFHIPNAEEWALLLTFLGGMEVAGGKMKTTSFDWIYRNIDASNSSGFSALPGGFRYMRVRDADLPSIVRSEGGFAKIGLHACFWSSKEYMSDTAWNITVSDGNGSAMWESAEKGFGLSVRCIKD